MAKVVETLTMSREEEIADCKKIMSNLLQGAISEHRSMSNLEQRKYDKYANRLAELKQLENENKQNGGNKMENTEFKNFLLSDEKRSFVDYATDEEARQLNTLADNGNVVTHTVAGEVIKRLNEESSLFAEAKLYVAQNQELNIPKEKAENVSQIVFVGEGVKLTSDKVSFDSVQCKCKRTGTAVKVSNEFLVTNSVNVENYVVDLLVRRLSQGLDYHMIKSEAEPIEGLDSLTVETHGIREVEAVLTSDVFVDMVAMMHPSLLNGCKFLMSRKTFANATKLKTSDGQYLVIFNFKKDTPAYEILGCPVEISDAMDDDKVYLVNMNRSYAKVIRQGVQIKRVNADEENVLAGTQMYVLDFQCGAVCVNGDGVVRLKMTTAQE